MFSICNSIKLFEIYSALQKVEHLQYNFEDSVMVKMNSIVLYANGKFEVITTTIFQYCIDAAVYFFLFLHLVQKETVRFTFSILKCWNTKDKFNRSQSFSVWKCSSSSFLFNSCLTGMVKIVIMRKIENNQPQNCIDYTFYLSVTS